MRNETFKTNDGMEYTRISKIQANKLFNSGTRIFLLPCNYNPFSPWVCLYGTTNNNWDNFSQLYNSYCDYNCNSNESGLYPKFYVANDDLLTAQHDH